VRRKIRAYVAVEGLAATVATAGLALAAALFLDWFFEPIAAVRLGLVAAGAVAVVVVFYRRFLRRVFARLADRNLALVVERRYRDLNESLLTAVEIDPASLSDYGRSLLDDARRGAAQRLASADVGDLFDPRPRRQAVAAALLLAAGIGAFGLARPDLLRLGVERLLAQSNEPWPRRSQLTIEGFVNGERVVPQGAEVELIVAAEAKQHVVPDNVYIRYRTQDGVRDEQVMDREGVHRPGVDAVQKYKLAFHHVSSSMSLDVVGGDARLRGLKLRVVERPQVRLRLKCKYPPYTGRADGELDVTGPVPLPQGTIVSALAHANKPLRSVVLDQPDVNGVKQERRLDLSRDGRPVQDFSFDVGQLTTDGTVTLRLLDDDGIENQTHLTLVAVVDQPPTIAVTRRALEPVATPQARLPFRGKVSDDYGVARLWFEYGVEGLPAQQRLLAVQPKGARELAVDDGLELREAFSATPLAIGQTILVGVRGEDNRDVAGLGIGGGNVAGGDVATLTIVTDTELLRLLEAREIMFREQFKALIEKVTRSRDGLLNIGEAPAAKPTPDEEPLPKNRDAVLVEQTRNREKEQRTETLLVADGFAAIVDELVNNRAADSDRLRERLSDEIARPLHRIGNELFADYELQLTKLHAEVSKPAADAQQVAVLRREAVRSVDAILVEMNVVLGQMQELESFKEAVDLLKTIIALQREVGDRTKKSREDKSRLLE
jgi:hypothetical protein